MIATVTAGALAAGSVARMLKRSHTATADSRKARCRRRGGCARGRQVSMSRSALHSTEDGPATGSGAVGKELGQLPGLADEKGVVGLPFVNPPA